MSKIIIAILIYMGAANTSTDVTPEMVEEHNTEIDYFKNDPGFLEFYESTTEGESIGFLDIHDAD